MKIIKGDLILIEDYEKDDNLKVEGNIYGKDGIRYNINARNIDAWNINARNINARNIDARNIDAGNIIYYAVCFAYNNFKCKSIKGRRDNCKHFVLDGEIIIKDEEEKA